MEKPWLAVNLMRIQSHGRGGRAQVCMPAYLHSLGKEGFLISIIFGQMTHHKTIDMVCAFICTNDICGPKVFQFSHL